MQIGVALNMDWLADIPRLAQVAVELDQIGFDYLTTGGHLLTSRPGRYPDRNLIAYSVPYRDPFVLFSHLAAVTTRIRFRTSVLILPMLPTALVAKQAADLSLLSAGRFELGVGISWQDAEYRALGQQMRQRGRKLDEQLQVLRLLWREPMVTFKGAFHDLDEIGIGQLPDRPIPIWLGSAPEPRQLRRAAEQADGWMPADGVRAPGPVRQLHDFARTAGRRDRVRVAGRVVAAPAAAPVVAEAQSQVAAGATELRLVAPPGIPLREGVAAVVAARRWIDDAIS